MHHAIQTKQAWIDWRVLAGASIAAGHRDLVEKFSPPDGAGWRKVDRCADKLTAAIAARNAEAQHG